MAVLSVLRSGNCSASNFLRRFTSLFQRQCSLPKKTALPASEAFSRGMASGAQVERSMFITASRFHQKKFADALHFYTLLGVIPLGLLILYVNIFIGQAELAEIPEEYEPQHWEYYKHPISRFIARYFVDDPQEAYEMTLSALREKQEQVEWRKTVQKVLQLQRERDDYRGFYWMPSDQGVYMRYGRKEQDDRERRMGYQ